MWRSMPFSAVIGNGDYDITDVGEADVVSGSDRIWDREQIERLTERRLEKRQRYLAELRDRVQLDVQSAEQCADQQCQFTDDYEDDLLIAKDLQPLACGESGEDLPLPCPRTAKTAS